MERKANFHEAQSERANLYGSYLLALSKDFFRVGGSHIYITNLDTSSAQSLQNLKDLFLLDDIFHFTLHIFLAKPCALNHI